MSTQNKRERLIDSAAELFHRNGMSVTSLADIAKHADIPIGNVYYYFKTKEELSLSVVNKRKEQFSAAYSLLDEGFEDPRQRLIEALHYFESVREEYAKYGCPVGRIIEDANVKKDNVAKTAALIFADFVEWAERQFRQLGHTADGHTYATSMMAGVQGATVMAKAFGDPDIISREVGRMVAWIESLPNRRIQLGKVGLKTLESAA
jgi:TetR/AcrR family transcriptional regulator, transcriptional repressor for nem operon